MSDNNNPTTNYDDDYDMCDSDFFDEIDKIVTEYKEKKKRKKQSKILKKYEFDDSDDDDDDDDDDISSYLDAIEEKVNKKRKFDNKTKK